MQKRSEVPVIWLATCNQKLWYQAPAKNLASYIGSTNVAMYIT